jgi:hypothetical protein
MDRADPGQVRIQDLLSRIRICFRIKILDFFLNPAYGTGIENCIEYSDLEVSHTPPLPSTQNFKKNFKI